MARTARENVRDEILRAAEKRLFYFGYKKTTIDEIAADAGVGKGTVYLYFESKEDIYCAIVEQYKSNILAEQEKIAESESLRSIEKVRQFLKLPILGAYELCTKWPQSVDMISAIRGQLADRLQPLIEREFASLAEILAQGSQRGELAVANPQETARTLKLMTLTFLPPEPGRHGTSDVEQELDRIVDLAYRGLRPH